MIFAFDDCELDTELYDFAGLGLDRAADLDERDISFDPPPNQAARTG